MLIGLPNMLRMYAALLKKSTYYVYINAQYLPIVLDCANCLSLNSYALLLI